MKFQLLFSLGCAVLLAGCGKKSSPVPSAGAPTPTTTAQPVAPVPRPVGEQASATPNDFTTVTAKLDAGGDLFMYWNAAQATAELDKGIGLIENQVNQIVQIEEADGGWVDEELLATRGLARFARSLISEGGLGEIKGLGMSSLALEEDLFRNRIYLHRDQEKTPGMLFEVLNGPDETVVTAMKFAPASTVMAHYTRANVGVAIDWIKLALIKSGMPDKALRDLLGPLGLYNQNDILKAHFDAPLTPEAQAFVGRWSGNDNNPENLENYEILRRSDGTYVYWLYGENEDGKRMPFVLEGRWKVEGKIFSFADTHENGKPMEYLTLCTETVEQAKANRLVTRELNFREFGGGEEMEGYESEMEAFPEPEEPVEPDAPEDPDAFRDAPGDDSPFATEAVPAEESFEGPLVYTENRVAAFKAPQMVKYNNAEAIKPTDKKMPAEVVSTSPVDAVLAQYGGELGLYLTLDQQRPLPFKQGSQSMDLPRPGIVLVVKASEGIQLKNLLLPLATESPEGMLTHSTVADTVVYTLNPPEELPIKMKLAPSVFQVGDHFVLVSDLALAKEVLAVHQGTQPGLAGTAAFQRLSTGMELKGQQLQFVSPRAAEMAVGLKQLVSVLLQRTEMPEEGLSFFKSLTDQLLNEEGASGHLAVLKLDAEGLMFDGRASGRGYSESVKQSALIPVTMMASAMLGGQEVAESTPQARFPTAARKQLRELTLGLKLYLEDHGEIPGLANWGDAILPEVGVKGVFVETGAQGSSYALNENLKGWKAEDIGPDTVLIFQSAGPFNHTGGLAEAKKEANKKETGGILVGFGDGNVRPIGAAQLDGLNWSKKKMVPKSETE